MIGINRTKEECWVIITKVTRKAMANKTTVHPTTKIKVIEGTIIKVHKILTLKTPHPVVGKPTRTW
jgi:hypothetical protein